MAPGTAHRPLLLCDVDGVLNPDRPPETGGTPLRSGRHRAVVPDDMVDRVTRLGEHFELWWATAWEDHANAVLAPHFGLPPLPVVRLTVGGLDSWKLSAIHATLRRCAPLRPVAWVDDHIGPRAQRWAASRGVPTLVLPVDARTGLDDGHVEQLCDFARTCPTAGPHPAAAPAPDPRVEGLGVRRALFLAGRRLRPRP